MPKVLTLFCCDPLQKIHLKKDVYFAGSSLAKLKGYEHELVGFRTPKTAYNYTAFGDDAEEGIYENTKVTLLDNKNFEEFLCQKAKSIDILVLFHSVFSTLKLAKLYKKLNRKGKVYVKTDFEPRFETHIIPKGIKNDLLRRVYRKMFVWNQSKYVDVFSAETKRAYDVLAQEGLFSCDISKKLVYMPNGIDDLALSIKKKSFEEKENLIITVGRLGTEQKNSEMLIEAIKNVELDNWRVMLIGGYTDEFRALYEDTIKMHPHLKDKLILKGNCSDKQELYEYYNSAKAFVLTSKWESFGLVLTEALSFGNYIFSTDVGFMQDIICNGPFGEVITDSKTLSKALQSFIDKNNYEEVESEIKFAESLSWDKLIKVVGERL